MSTSERIELEHLYAHPPRDVWRALTEPRLLARWWAAGDVRPVVGHRFTLDMGAWGPQPCTVLAVEPERLFQITFAEGSLDTTLSFRLTPEGDGTRLTLIHEGFDLDAPLARRALEGMGRGWPGVLARLPSALGESG